MNSNDFYKAPKFDYLILLPILALAFYIAFIPNQNYPYLVHIDEWNLLSNIKALQNAGSISYADPYYSGAVHPYTVMETGFHLFWGTFQSISGLPWITVFRYFPSIIFMMTVLSVYIMAHREGFGWEAAFFTCLILTMVGILGPGFLVPVAMALLFIPLSIFLAFNFRHGWSYVVVFIFTCFLLSMHGPSAVCLLLILFPYALLNLKGNFKHGMALILTLVIPFLIATIVAFDLVLTMVRELLVQQDLPWYVDYPNIIGNYGYLPYSLGLIGVLMLAIRGSKKDYSLLSGLIVVLIMLTVFSTLHYGVRIVYDRGLIIMMLMLGVVAGAGLMWIKNIKIPESFAVRLKVPLISQNIGKVLCLALIVLILAVAIPNRQDTFYYHMIDDYDYEAFVWIRDNISDDYEKSILDPWEATAFTAITQKRVFTRIHAYPTATDEEARTFLENGCSETTFLRKNGISIVYSRLPCSNPDLTEVRDNVYLLKEAE